MVQLPITNYFKSNVIQLRNSITCKLQPNMDNDLAQATRGSPITWRSFNETET